MKMFKKSICLVLSVLTVMSAAFFMSAAVSAKAKPALNKKKITITRTKSYALKLKNAKASKVKWSTSKKSVAVVYSGKVTALKIGKATITAKYNGKKYRCKVTVKPLVTMTKYDFTVYKNDTLKLSISSKNSKYNAKSWKSSNPSIASINSNGLITGINYGTVTITATKSNGDLLKTKVNVINPFKALKNYINEKGKSDKDGNKYLSFGNGKYSYFITYNKETDMFEFQGNYNGTGTFYEGQFELIMYMDNGGSSTLPVISLYLSDDDTKSYKAQSYLNASSYTQKSNIKFTALSGNVDDENVNSLSNLLLHDLFGGWAEMLDTNLNMNLSALGFSKYE